MEETLDDVNDLNAEKATNSDQIKHIRIGLIGAGASGLALLRAFEKIRETNHVIPQIVCYEKQAECGGLWNYTWRTGLDEHGEPVHGSMYRYLWSNGPKECLEFADYSFEEHFGKSISSYPPRAVLHHYIKGRIDKSNVQNYIHFNTVVRWVSYCIDREKFTVTVKDLKKDTMTSEEFDYVVVASGHFSVPHIPYFEGLDKFPGRVLHAHDFRGADEFVGKNLLLIGSSYSAEDIGVQCHKYGAKTITISYRTRPMSFKWPSNMKEVPLLIRVIGRTAHFKDGSIQENIDAIILCTGYLHSFPFLPDDLRLKTYNRLYPSNLYKGIFWLDNPKLIYLGMQDQYFTFNMFDSQAWYARDVILKRIILPTRKEMEMNIREWLENEEKVVGKYDAIDFQAEYIRDLLQYTDYPTLDVQHVAKLFKEWEDDKDENILTYRDKTFPSVITGTMAPKHHTHWIEAHDDTLETYLNEHRTLSNPI
ncbi:unnamed protein product [Didymodactylos carnosus]|uniref:Flavin-containing monooxygenase n=1 Tax=Didymodactylos carnosus TaxID=1234261 RepID=A0A8S2EB16_9BILA|nr:unnamed protein product [Didymodactylos carnosus]CAF3989643.1 unnamed protein product [Didymodactylos carnosus]